MKRFTLLALAVLLFSLMLTAVPGLAQTTYYTYWEETFHPRRGGPSGQDDVADWGPYLQDDLVKATGKAFHSWDTFEDYPSYTFVKNYVQVYDKESGYYVFKGLTMEYFWMSDWTLLASEDLGEYMTNNPGVFILFHMKDYFIGVAKYDSNGMLEWIIYRQYSYWIQTQYTRDAYGFPEEIGDRIHATWTGTTYIPSDELWQSTSTYWILPEGTVPSTADPEIGPIYGAFPDSFTGFQYKWLP